jgi:hypothetical protein
MTPAKPKGRTTPKKAKQPEAPPEPRQIPARPADIKIAAINADNLLVTFVSENGMQVSNFTIGYDQWREIVANTLPWLDQEREAKPDLTVVEQDKRLVGPYGSALDRRKLG